MILLSLSFLFLVSCTNKSLDWAARNPVEVTGKLVGYNSSQAFSISNSVSAMGCNSPQASLYILDSDGNRIEPAASTVSVVADGSYKFSLKDIAINASSKKPTEAAVVVITGCSSGVFMRPLTAYRQQDITPGTTLLSYLLNTADKKKLADASLDKTDDLEKLIASLAGSADTSDAYNLLISSAATQYSDLFGVPATKLQSAFPQNYNLLLPTVATEQQAISMNVDSAHWYSSYSMVHKWKLDGVLIGQTSHFTYTPSGNSQGQHILSLEIGSNDGSGGLDATKPSKTYTSVLNIANTVFPTVPSFTVTNPTVVGSSPINSRNLTLTMNTGAGKINCDSFASLAVTEVNTAPSSSAFNVSCSTAPSQNFSYTLLSPGDGAKSLYLWSIDSAGVVSAMSSTFSFNLDTAIPLANITNTPLALTNSNSQSFSFTGSDNGATLAGFECNLDSVGWIPCSSPKSYSGLAEGDHTFKLRSLDLAGNYSVEDSKTWHVDLTAPVVSLAGSPASITNSVSANFTLSVIEAGGGAIASYACSLDGAVFSACAAINNYTLSAGSHSFSAKVTDTAGNVSATLYYSWIIDTSIPTVNIASKPASLNNSSSATFTFSGSDTGGGSVSGYECQIDGGGFSACSTTKNYTGLSSSSHTFSVKATDTAGNISTTVTYTWSIDTTTPIASINSGPDNVTNATSATFTFSANPPPAGSITGYECQLNSSGFTACSSPKTYSSMAQGSYTFQVRSIDNNNARSAATSFSWLIDTTNPVLTIGSQPASVVSSANATITFSATDSGGASVSGYQCKLDSGSFAACSSPKGYSSLPVGSHVVQIKAVDTAGNESAVSNISWTIDTSAPILSVTSAPASINNSTSAHFVFSAIDSGGGTVAGYTCSLDSATAVSCVSPLDYSSLAAGAHSLSIVVTDSVGNASAPTLISWIIDLNPPTLSITANPALNSNSGSASFSFTSSDTGGGSVSGYQCKLDSGSYASCVSPKTFSSLSEASHTFSVKSSDTAGNSSAVSSYTWTVDTTAPTISITTPSVNGTVVATAGLTTFSVGGACSENGMNVTLAGASASTAVCSSGTWSKNIDVSGLADGTLSLTASQTDAAGNSTTSATRTFIKDTVNPVINVTQPLVLRGNGAFGYVAFAVTDSNVASATTATVQIFNGSTWLTVGTPTITAGVNNNAAYSLSSFAVPNVEMSTAQIKVSMSDAAGNTTTTQTSNFSIDLSGPVLSSFHINGDVTTTQTNYIPVSIIANDSLSKITQFCILYNTTTQPAASDPCWATVQNAGLTPGTSLNLTDYYFRLGFTSGSYSVVTWLQNEVGLISNLTPTSGVDSANITYSAALPPVVSQVIAANNDAPATPPASSDLTSTSGVTPITVKWQISSTASLGATPVSIFYTTDDVNFTQLGSAVANAQGSGCTISGALTGCFVIPTAPSSTYYRIRVKATDTQNSSAQANSLAFNVANIRFLAGNTENGTGSSASAGVFLNTQQNDARTSDYHSLVVHPSGTIYFRDTNRGIVKVDPSTGLMTTFIKLTGASTGDGGPASSATVNLPLSLLLDSQNNLIIQDYNRIRKVTLSASPPTIATIVGGGADTSDSIADAKQMSLSVKMITSLNHNTVAALPNGDFIFRNECYGGNGSNNCGNKLRWYHAATGSITSIYFRGTPIAAHPEIDSSVCGHSDFAPIIDSGNNVTGFVSNVTAFPVSTGSACSYDGGYHFFAVSYDTSGNFVSNLTTSWSDTDQIILGRDNKIYRLKRSAIYRYNPATNTSAILAAAGNGYCDDGTLLSSCKFNLEDVFIDANGKIFIAENGAIRTVTDSNTLLTIAGQRLLFGDGLDPLQARFGQITSLGLWNDGSNYQVTVLDQKAHSLREFPLTNNSVVQTIAGNGINGVPNTTAAANTQPIFDQNSNSFARMFQQDASGNVFMPFGYSLIGKLDRSTGKWTAFAGGGGTAYYNGDGLIGTSVATPSPNGVLFTVGYGDGKLLVAPYTQNSGNTGLSDNPYFKLYDGNTKVQSQLAGFTGTAQTSNWCSVGTSLDACKLPLQNSGKAAYYDSISGAWLINYSIDQTIKKLVPGGTLQDYYAVPTAFINFTLYKTASVENLFYCDSSSSPYKIKKRNMLTSTTTTLSWPVSSMFCAGNNIIYNPDRNSLIFMYRQNGLYGVAEYLNP